MKNLKDLKLAKNFYKILSEASNEAEVISVESIIYYSILYCINGGEEEMAGSTLTFHMVKNLTQQEQKQLKDSLRELLDEVLIKELPSELSCDTITPFSTNATTMFKELEENKEDGISISSSPEIGIDDFIFHLVCTRRGDIVEVLNNYGINDRSYLKATVNTILDTTTNSDNNNFLNYLSLSDLIDKLIDYSGNPESPQNNSKDDEDSKPKGNYSSENFERAGEIPDIHTKKVDPYSETPTLDEFGINMTEEASKGAYDKVIGRDKELSQLVEILLCRKKNNAMVIGNAGTGKTALVEGLAQRIAEGSVPDGLKDKKIISISSTTLTAGTIYRGQLEERVQKLCAEVAKNRNIIIFIDEFHSTVSDNSNNISQMLKPSLSRGELTLIAGTTLDEYKKFVEKDSALKRRFQKVLLEEPSGEDTLMILKGVCDKYSTHHNVIYTEEALKLCVSLSERYLYDRNSPDRAIDLMDISGCHANLNHPTKTPTKLTTLENRLGRIKEKKKKAIIKEDYEEAFKYKEEQEKVEKQIHDLPTKGNFVTDLDIAEVVSSLSNVPIDKILNPDIDKIRNMGPKLKNIIIGQNEAIDIVTSLLSRHFLGLSDPNIPPSLYISGGTGTGKTYLAEEIAETVFGSRKSLIRIDCGELTQPHTVTKLIGAPPSYVGFGEIALFDEVRTRPHSLILVDEADKLCEEILNTIFLNILTTGTIKLSNGIDVSFKDCIFIFTSNDGTRQLEAHGSGIGFIDQSGDKSITKEIVLKAIKDRIRPEVINRFSGIIVFNNLGREELKKIYELELKKVIERIKAKGGINLKVSPEIRDAVVQELDLTYGARDLKRTITKWVEDPICNFILNNPDKKLKKLEVFLKDGKPAVK